MKYACVPFFHADHKFWPYMHFLFIKSTKDLIQNYDARTRILCGEKILVICVFEKGCFNETIVPLFKMKIIVF